MTDRAHDASPLEEVTTSGRSMAPLIRDRSHVVYARVPPEALHPGDILVFRSEGRTLAHRLIGRRLTSEGRSELREKGDHNLRGSWIPAESVLGRAARMRHDRGEFRLDIGTGCRRLRWLVRIMALEDALAERYVNLIRDRRALRGSKWIALPLAAMAAPARALLMRLLITAYPPAQGADEEGHTRFLLECVRTLFPGGPAAPPDLPAGAKAEALCFAAASHGLLPLLAALKPGDPHGVLSVEVHHQLRRATYRTALNHGAALTALGRIDRALKAATLPYAVLKGPFLYETLYRNRFPRVYEDIDLLVPADRLEAAVAALQTAGYRLGGTRLTRWLLRRGHFHLALEPVDPRHPPVELHWSLVDRANLYRIPDAELFARLTEWRAGDSTFSALDDTDELLYLCLHAAKHGSLNPIGLRHGFPAGWFCRASSGNRLLWFIDIALLLGDRAARLDWPALAKTVERWNVREDIADCLRLIDRLLPESPAADALRRLDIPAAGPAPVGSGWAWWLRSPRGRSFLDRANAMHPVLLFRPVRLLMLGRLIFPAPTRLRAYYGARHAWTLPFLYLRHPFHLARRLLGG